MAVHLVQQATRLAAGALAFRRQAQPGGAAVAVVVGAFDQTGRLHALRQVRHRRRRHMQSLGNLADLGVATRLQQEQQAHLRRTDPLPRMRPRLHPALQGALGARTGAALAEKAHVADGRQPRVGRRHVEPFDVRMHQRPQQQVHRVPVGPRIVVKAQHQQRQAHARHAPRRVHGGIVVEIVGQGGPATPLQHHRPRQVLAQPEAPPRHVAEQATQQRRQQPHHAPHAQPFQPATNGAGDAGVRRHHHGRPQLRRGRRQRDRMAAHAVPHRQQRQRGEARGRPARDGADIFLHPVRHGYGAVAQWSAARTPGAAVVVGQHVQAEAVQVAGKGLVVALRDGGGRMQQHDRARLRRQPQCGGHHAGLRHGNVELLHVAAPN
ncbi:conserved hypothetical protein [Ricinus communis]|uniref:Uncharacterized protein n=1 Tax=Ricinus communis TaxID=3988 RepID=B9TFV8_RICCO|nr:conserved hypothetical protein [Ricinus communis]